MNGLTFFILATYAAQIIQVCFFKVPSAGSTVEMLFRVKKHPARAVLHRAAASVRSPLKMTMLVMATMAVAATSLIPLISLVHPAITRLLVPFMAQPTGIMQIICILFLVSGNVLTYTAVNTLRSQVSFHEFGETTRLYTLGIYGWLRNPITVGLALIYAGFFLALPSAAMLSGFIIFMLNSFYRIKMEEDYLQSEFGEDYARYKRRVGKYFPKLWISR